MVLRIAFHLSRKVDALHLVKRTTKAYLYNHGGTASLFLSRIVCHILNLADKYA